MLIFLLVDLFLKQYQLQHQFVYIKENSKEQINDYEKIKRAYVSLFRKLEVEKEDLGKEELTNVELVNLKQEFIISCFLPFFYNF